MRFSPAQLWWILILPAALMPVGFLLEFFFAALTPGHSLILSLILSMFFQRFLLSDLVSDFDDALPALLAGRASARTGKRFRPIRLEGWSCQPALEKESSHLRGLTLLNLPQKCSTASGSARCSTRMNRQYRERQDHEPEFRARGALAVVSVGSSPVRISECSR